MDRVTATKQLRRLFTALFVPPTPESVLLCLTTAALVAGGVFRLAGAPGLANLCWALGTAAAVVPAIGWVLETLRHGRAGVDVIAVLALGGTLAVHEYLAGALIALMLASGRTLEAAAQRRASRDLRALLERAPRTARIRTGSGVRTVAAAEVAVGDLVVVGPGEVVPVDGRVASTAAVLDESALTGEPLGVKRARGEAVRSGVVDAGGAFELRATATEQDSTYAGIVRLARQAGAESAPVVRLADRYAAWFLPLSVAAAGLAWLLSGSAVRAAPMVISGDSAIAPITATSAASTAPTSARSIEVATSCERRKPSARKGGWSIESRKVWRAMAWPTTSNAVSAITIANTVSAPTLGRTARSTLALVATLVWNSIAPLCGRAWTARLNAARSAFP